MGGPFMKEFHGVNPHIWMAVCVIPVSFEIKMTQAMIFGIHWVPCIEDILEEKAILLCHISCPNCCFNSGQRLSVSSKKRRSRISQGELLNWLRYMFLTIFTTNKQNPLGFYLIFLIEAYVIKHVIYDEFQEWASTGTHHYKGKALLGVEK